MTSILWRVFDELDENANWVLPVLWSTGTLYRWCSYIVVEGLLQQMTETI